MIDASEIYTPQRAQDYMSEDDIAEVYKLYTDYQDVIERCKIVTLKDIKDKGYTLSTNVYIEKKPVPITPPSVVRDPPSAGRPYRFLCLLGTLHPNRHQPLVEGNS